MKRKRSTRSTSLRNVPETHSALLNDVVLQNIFKYLSYTDLKSCRDVKNKIWLRNSMKAWWARTQVVFTGGQPQKVTDFQNEPKLSSHARNYKLMGFKGVFHGVWENFGHSIKSLELRYIHLKSLEDFRQIIFTKCPNLEKLIAEAIMINCNPRPDQPMKWQKPEFGEQKNLKFLRLKFVAGCMPLSLMDLLSHFPNLQALETCTDVDICKVIAVIRQHDPKMLKLNHIDIHFPLGIGTDYEESIRLVLLDSSLSFETIRIDYESCKPATLVEILNLHAKSLTELRLQGEGSPKPMELPLRQPLLKLDKLSIVGCMFTADIFKFTPNLRKVLLHYGGDQNLLKMRDPNLRINTCKELRVNIVGKWEESPDSDFAFYLDVFPNVEVLEIDALNNQKFSMVCERWNKLVSFTVPNESAVDTVGLLGFNPASKAKRARKPNIADLTGLQLFSMHSTQYHRKKRGAIVMKNGDVVLKELEGLPHLKTFELIDYEFKDDQAWKEIFAKYPNPDY